ncbi:MAG: hypothetical protein GY762_23330 [Proteobacteria bacterium]|nr:hypothetical protein [Pseudomonadota bacterium]
MRKKFAIAFILVLAGFVAGPAAADGTRSRTYTHQFETTCPLDRVMDVFYAAKHYKNYTPDAKRVTILEKGTESYVVKYEYSHIWGRVELVYKKSIFPEQGKVAFELLKYENTNSFLPKIVHSVGYYRVEPGPHGKNTVTYYQKFVFDSDLNWVYRKIFDSKNRRARNKLINYIQSLAGRD